MKVIIMEDVSSFITKLDLDAQERIDQRLIVLETFGHMIRMPHSKFILPGIFELRMLGKDNIRLIYTFRYDNAVVFHVFLKKTQRITTQEMNTIKQKYNRLHL